MGIIQEEYIIAQTYSDDSGISGVDQWIKDLPIDWRNHFVKLPCHTNGYLTYFMNWDGSKEGWGTSNVGDKLRQTFCAVLNNTLEWSNVLHIKPEGEIFQESSIIYREDTEIMSNSEIFEEENEE